MLLTKSSEEVRQTVLQGTQRISHNKRVSEGDPCKQHITTGTTVGEVRYEKKKEKPTTKYSFDCIFASCLTNRVGGIH